jgi:OOP family OmpA-OmpF porin
MTKQLKLSALVAALLVSASAFAAKPGYMADQSTDNVVRDNYNECWKTNTFDKATQGLVQCGDKVAAPVAAAVAPAAAAPVVKHEKVTLSAKVLFGFNKFALRAEAKSVLQPLLAHLNAGNLKSVEVNGYTDYMGAEKLNLKLSQKRADAVKNYFVAGGVPADKVIATGHGAEGAKMTAECKAQFKKKSQRTALKNCIEPDRRVELLIDTVEVAK